jgi:hypothetical protein
MLPLCRQRQQRQAGGSWPSNGQGLGCVVADDVLYFQGDRGARWLHHEAPPAYLHLRRHQVDLSDYADVPFRIRFRYNSGIVSFAPESPGWWVDDITVSGASWQTIGSTAPDDTHFVVAPPAPGPVSYRIQAVYQDGSGSAWSNVQSWP